MATKKNKKGNAKCEICGRELEVQTKGETVYCLECYSKYSLKNKHLDIKQMSGDE